MVAGDATRMPKIKTPSAMRFPAVAQKEYNERFASASSALIGYVQ
jgi:hypothetical protein